MNHLIPSQHGRSDDPIFALNREANRRREKGEAIVNGTLGALLEDDGKLAILPTAAQAVREVKPVDWATYAPIAGNPDYLQAVIAEVFAEAPELREAAIASATPGGSGALHHAIVNFLEPGQSILTSGFYWGPYQTLADAAGRGVVTFRMFDPEGKLDLEAFDRALGEQLRSQGRAVVLLNDPCHNPTGYSLQPGEWTQVLERLAGAAERGPVTLVLDMAYAAYGDRSSRALVKQLSPLLGKALLLVAWTASKTYTHYGLRVGALLACTPDAQERAAIGNAMAYASRGTWSNCNRGGQAAITRLLAEPALAAACDRERSVLRELLHRRVAAFNALAPARGIRYPRYEGGFFVTVFHPDPAIKAAAMREQGVFVVPQLGESDARGLRVGLCAVAERDIPKLVDALAEG
jgi:aromatic-amino-acid transaminase